MKPRSSVRMADVAQAAGVAPATVSRAINEPDKVAPETRAQVEAAVRKLGYVPDRTASSLASSRSKIVGAIVPTLANVWFAETMEGLAAELGKAGYQLMLSQSSYVARTEAGLIDGFLGRRVDALVLTGALRDTATRAKLRAVKLPVVETWDLPARPVDMAVGFSNQEVGAEVARRLLKAGRRRIAFLGADEHRSLMRRTGFERELQAAGRPLIASEFTQPPSTIAAGRVLMEQLVAAHPDVDAVFCGNDFLAIGALMWARAHGWDVPGRVAVVGFSDLPVAEATWPPLTTVKVRGAEMGRRAGEMVLARLRGEEPARKSVDVGFEFVERSTL
ncbi:LacI family DNA-binding transcriptional regulator [Ramlibacter humi]|uniref:LacI family DNA-binding transcriptional regulator n=1 Tax=Ramlibacter humi TaxID=2530451 RepID=A0A4Z0BGZ9_9BURK|nr:LacI family DNA-binding transcriptional regulator [Ramlibacter humi]TFY97743.1 LacI family DNA-binding transcriptional regulator [Ramlibacter humi]